MERIYRDEEVLELSQGTYFIHDAIVTRFDINQEDHRLQIEVYFTSIDSKWWPETKLKLRFIDIIEYGFYWNASYSFYYVERYKFFRNEKGFYMSLCPTDENGSPSDDDGDVIISKSIEGYLL
ncbi:hypothetical protein [Mucilaginibacter psychrotolerans]|uniref:Uncharacterized protein n=1 Tax=Mucilaginibacter psychrotolerans TaxID=1524096 RepID=A0A4Y8SEW9_9SPHI|nr:hypothetical protein [Mucilaginibacter psychrotolerans]TFF37462.1 hypothetical protein E2R66_11690 [Mucilaginibacter psychrotolerans]